MMNWDDLRLLHSNDNFIVGGHSHNHDILANFDENNNLKEQSRLGAIGNAALKQMNIEPKNKVVDPKPGVYKTTVQITNDKKLKVTLPEGTFEYSSYKHLPLTKKV